MRLRHATYNIHGCVGRDGMENYARVATVLHEIRADIVALQEVTSHHEAVDDMLAYLAAATGMQAIEGFTLKTAGAHYGNALLSRLTISAVNRFDLSIAGREPRGMIEAVVDFNRRPLMLWATHLGLGSRERLLQMQKILKIIQAAETEPGILLGDFNEWLPWGRPLRILHRWFTRFPSPATFPSHRPLLKLDRILIRPGKRLSALWVHWTRLSRLASDHLPLVADILL